MKDHLPKKLSIFIGGFMGPSYLVEMDLKESVLRYQYFRNETKKELKIQPTPQQWEKFWIQMNKSKVWSWKPFYEISNDAWNDAKIIDPESENTWLYAPGRGGEYWDDFYSKGIMAIGWDYLGDLSKTKLEIADAIRNHDKDPESSKKNNANSCFSFCRSMRVGDSVFAKVGNTKIVGWGIIISEYFFDNTRETFKHIRKVDWKGKGQWVVNEDNRFALKTVTDITKYSKFVLYLQSLVDSAELPSESIQYWWLNANPKIWDLGAVPIGTKETYTSHNAKGNKRRVYQYFAQVKPGDILLGYIASPLRQISALCKVTNGLHSTPEGEAFEFEKIEQFPEPVSFGHLQSVPGLEKCEPLINNQGSLFKLKTEEYEIIRSILDEANEFIEGRTSQEPEYTIEECSKAIGYSLDKLYSWKGAIGRKKQAVFYGPPGTGKTFIAHHLAKHIVGGSDGIIDCIQFYHHILSSRRIPPFPIPLFLDTEFTEAADKDILSR
jgi:5-methylcytosine-specific restriction protein B